MPQGDISSATCLIFGERVTQEHRELQQAAEDIPSFKACVTGDASQEKGGRLNSKLTCMGWKVGIAGGGAVAVAAATMVTGAAVACEVGVATACCTAAVG
jgi:hypothetical protein